MTLLEFIGKSDLYTEAMNEALRDLSQVLAEDQAIAFTGRVGNDHERVLGGLCQHFHYKPYTSRSPEQWRTDWCARHRRRGDARVLGHLRRRLLVG